MQVAQRRRDPEEPDQNADILYIIGNSRSVFLYTYSIEKSLLIKRYSSREDETKINALDISPALIPNEGLFLYFSRIMQEIPAINEMARVILPNMYINSSKSMQCESNPLFPLK
jgi:hypothetical protein